MRARVLAVVCIWFLLAGCGTNTPAEQTTKDVKLFPHFKLTSVEGMTCPAVTVDQAGMPGQTRSSRTLRATLGRSCGHSYHRRPKSIVICTTFSPRNLFQTSSESITREHL